VIDYFDIGVGTLRNASNFADWSIVLGVILLGVATLLESQAKQANVEEARHSIRKCDSLHITLDSPCPPIKFTSCRFQRESGLGRFAWPRVAIFRARRCAPVDGGFVR
jgi:hypothetical protein